MNLLFDEVFEVIGPRHLRGDHVVGEVNEVVVTFRKRLVGPNPVEHRAVITG